MQPNQLSPIAVAILATMLSACGGGGDEPPPPAPVIPPAITVSSVSLSTSTPRAFAEDPLQFNGGVCSGGKGTLTASWDFGDGTGTGSSNTHTYAEANVGAKVVTVTCTDSAGTAGAAAKSTKFNVIVESAAMKGFLGKEWSSYSSINPLRPSLYPVAGLANSGDVYGVWLPSIAPSIFSGDAADTKAISGTTNFSSSKWTLSADDLSTGTDKSPFDDTQPGVRTTAIDLAVSPKGNAIAAWVAVSSTGSNPSIWYTTKSGLTAAWAIPKQISVPVLNESIKVAINDDGVSAIAYCTGTTKTTTTTTGALTYTNFAVKDTVTGAEVITNLSAPVPVRTVISNQCDTVDVGYADLQRHPLFGIAIDNTSSTIYAVGVASGATVSTNSVVRLKSLTSVGGLIDTKDISGEMATSPKSLSFSRSPNGKFAAIAWNQVNTVSPFYSNVFTSIYANDTWSAGKAIQDDFTTKDYTRPLIAVNDTGIAFLAMQLNFATSPETEVATYDAAKWSAPNRGTNISTPSESQFNMTDVAIDNWGTGLITRLDKNSRYTQAGTFSKTGTWSGFKNILPLNTPNYPGLRLHSQAMRALPDGRAILFTSIYDDITPRSGDSKPWSSGYVLLK